MNSVDYTAFRESHPRSILVMPPVNRTVDINATATFLATSTIPLAESGYYVIPAALSVELFKQNGVTVAEDAHAIAYDRLHEIFGADAALYITITRFGVTYVLIDSVVEAAGTARLIDLRSGRELWSGQASVSSGSNIHNDNIFAMLLTAMISQVVNTISENSHNAGRQANRQMLSAGTRNGILYGPYHPRFGTD
jgi:hypothetical protein